MPSDVNTDRLASEHAEYFAVSQVEGDDQHALKNVFSEIDFDIQKGTSWLSRLNLWPDLYLDRSGTHSLARQRHSTEFWGSNHQEKKSFKPCLVRYELVCRTMINYRQPVPRLNDRVANIPCPCDFVSIRNHTCRSANVKYCWHRFDFWTCPLLVILVFLIYFINFKTLFGTHCGSRRLFFCDKHPITKKTLHESYIR